MPGRSRSPFPLDCSNRSGPAIEAVDDADRVGQQDILETTVGSSPLNCWLPVRTNRVNRRRSRRAVEATTKFNVERLERREVPSVTAMDAYSGPVGDVNGATST